MKRALNMMAELMALPYSQYLFKRDPVRIGLDRTTPKGDRGSSLWNTEALGQAFDEECQYAAEYINQFTEITSLTELQSMFHYVFSPKEICVVSTELDKQFSALKKANAFDVETGNSDDYYLPQFYGSLKHTAFANQFYINN